MLQSVVFVAKCCIIDVEVGIQSDGTKILFGVGTNNAQHHVEQNNDGTWDTGKNWYGIGGWIKDIEILTNNDGSLEVYGISSDKSIWRNTQDSNGNWGWEKVAKPSTITIHSLEYHILIAAYAKCICSTKE